MSSFFTSGRSALILNDLSSSEMSTAGFQRSLSEKAGMSPSKGSDISDGRLRDSLNGLRSVTAYMGYSFVCLVAPRFLGDVYTQRAQASLYAAIAFWLASIGDPSIWRTSSG